MSTGSGAEHGGPVTPSALVSDSEPPSIEPETFAVPTQSVFSSVRPVNVSFALSDDPLRDPTKPPDHS